MTFLPFFKEKRLAGLKTAEDIDFPFHDPEFSPCVAVGGVGGSGTRVLVSVLEALGIRFSADLNEMNDNLWFTLLFKHLRVLELSDADFDELLRIFLAANIGGLPLSREHLRLLHELQRQVRPHPERPQHDQQWLFQRFRKLVSAAFVPPRNRGPWGWKEPNTHVCIDRILDRLPQLKYIHVVRNGFDMAHSSNKGQLMFWGERFLGRPVQDNPADALSYWCAVHRRMLKLDQAYPGRILFVCYENLCRHPEREIRRICSFLHWPCTDAGIRQAQACIRPSRTIGRYRQHSMRQFSLEDRNFVRGFMKFLCRSRLAYEDAGVSGGKTDPSSTLVDLLQGVEGWMPEEEASLLCRLARDCEGDVVEIGSYRGRSTIALAYGIHLSGRDALVHAIDPHAAATGVFGGQFSAQDRVHFLENILDSGLAEHVALINLPSHIVARAWDKEVGLLFIDGDHRYEAVKRDFEMWFPHVRHAGFIVLDDTAHKDMGPARLVREIVDSGACELVKQAGKLCVLRKC